MFATSVSIHAVCERNVGAAVGLNQSFRIVFIELCGNFLRQTVIAGNGAASSGTETIRSNRFGGAVVAPRPTNAVRCNFGFMV